MFNELLFIDTLRGDNSTGMMLVDSDGNVEIAKEASDAQYFQSSKEYTRILGQAYRDGAALIGHNRKATRGVISDENAHPFIVDDRIVLMHNGTLYGDHKKIADVDVDSHAIAHLIHEKGDDVEAALKEINGAYALIWYDVNNRSMNFVRNKERPLCFIETSMAWYWASEPGMLSWILSRNQIMTDNKITLLKDGTLQSYKREGRQWKMETKELDLTKKTVFHTVSDNVWNSWHEDACAFNADRRGHRHPYETVTPHEEADSRLFRIRATNTALPPAPTKPGDRAHFTVKVLDGELKRARDAGCSSTITQFQNFSSKHSARSWMDGTAFDYQYVRGDDCTNGVFIYAKAVEDNEIILRGYMQYDPSKGPDLFEKKVMNLCLGDQKCMFKISHKGWTAFPDGELGTGMSCFYGTDVYEIQKKSTAANA